jgi:hypothetical protein
MTYGPHMAQVSVPAIALGLVQIPRLGLKEERQRLLIWDVQNKNKNILIPRIIDYKICLVVLRIWAAWDWFKT